MINEKHRTRRPGPLKLCWRENVDCQEAGRERPTPAEALVLPFGSPFPAPQAAPPAATAEWWRGTRSWRPEGPV